LRLLILILLVGLAEILPAQEPPAEAPAQEEAAPPSEYSGPALLSRHEGATVARGSELLRLRPFVSVNGIYDSGLLSVAVDQNGTLPNQRAWGEQLEFGVVGSHPWRRTRLDLDYRGSFNHYNRRTYYDGFNSSFLMSVTHQVSRRVTFQLGETFATYSRSMSLPGMSGAYGGPVPYPDPSYQGLVGNDIYDSRTNALMSTGRFTFQKSARLSFSGGGNAFFVRRRSAALAGVNGYGATGDVAYRLSRYQTIGLQYSYNQYDFTSLFGGSSMHGLAANYAVRLGRRWELALLGGGYRIEVLRVQQVQIDPVIAALLGRSYGLGILYKTRYAPNLGANLTRSFRRATLGFAYTRMVTPGNGVYLTSGSETESVNYSYVGFKRLNIGLSAGSTSYTALAQTLGKYRNYHAGGGFTYRLIRNLSLVQRTDGRKYQIGGTGFNRTGYRVSLGLAWSHGDIPLALW
jgi:hypothetical protein